MTKDNWIKELPKEVKDILVQVADGALSMEGLRADEYTLDMIDRENEKGIYKQTMDFISQVEKDARSESYTNGYRDGFDAGVEKTNKRWRLRVEKLKPPMEDDEETTVYRHCNEGDHWKCGGYGEDGACLCKCHALSNLSNERDKNV